MVSRYHFISDLFMDFASSSRPIDRRHLERVPQYNLADYHARHIIQNPSCFCANAGSGSRVVTETAIYTATTGPYRGFWVTGCAQAVCSYFGKPSPMAL